MSYTIIYISIIIYLIALLFLLLFFVVMGEGVQTIKQRYTVTERQPRGYKQAERQRNYLELLNMTTGEVLLFKDKKEFINSMTGYETVKHFLKGTEEENIKKLIDWYYPGFERV